MTPLSSELYWLVATAVFTSVLWAPHILQRIYEMKPYAAFRDPRHDHATQAPWAQRAIRAHSNAVENLVIVAVLVMAIEMSGAGTQATATAMMVYFYARVAHFAIYVLALPWLRTPMYLVGFACQMVLAWHLLVV